MQRLLKIVPARVAASVRDVNPSISLLGAALAGGIVVGAGYNDATKVKTKKFIVHHFVSEIECLFEFLSSD